MKTKYFKSLVQMEEILSAGHEMNFTLLGFDYYFGAPSGKYVLSREDGLDVEFDSLNEFYNYSINQIPIKELWQEIDVDMIY